MLHVCDRTSCNGTQVDKQGLGSVALKDRLPPEIWDRVMDFATSY